MGGIPAKSPADAAANADLVFTCLPSDEALEEVVNGPRGIATTAKPGQIVVEFGSCGSIEKKIHRSLGGERCDFHDGEVGGTPGMVEARKGVIYLSGDKQACERLEPIVKAFAEISIFLGPFLGPSTT